MCHSFFDNHPVCGQKSEFVEKTYVYILVLCPIIIIVIMQIIYNNTNDNII